MCMILGLVQVQIHLIMLRQSSSIHINCISSCKCQSSSKQLQVKPMSELAKSWCYSFERILCFSPLYSLVSSDLKRTLSYFLILWKIFFSFLFMFSIFKERLCLIASTLTHLSLACTFRPYLWWNLDLCWMYIKINCVWNCLRTTTKFSNFCIVTTSHFFYVVAFLGHHHCFLFFRILSWRGWPFGYEHLCG